MYARECSILLQQDYWWLAALPGRSQGSHLLRSTSIIMGQPPPPPPPPPTTFFVR
ncbi:hypothetical protein BHE74_00025986 [Ensete ventricosum]|nr:hypothetical protein BHE74_00025986 [Ensete ventricosum]